MGHRACTETLQCAPRPSLRDVRLPATPGRSSNDVGVPQDGAPLHDVDGRPLLSREAEDLARPDLAGLARELEHVAHAVDPDRGGPLSHAPSTTVLVAKHEARHWTGGRTPRCATLTA
jgi:hypothetical protein